MVTKLTKLHFTNSSEENYSQTFLTILVSGPGYSLNAQIRVNMNFKDKIAIEISQCLQDFQSCFLKTP